ncbi:MAG: MOSC domain-containing protein [Elusimicrobia bacterium]|nr:MOSC domain-containing protein [Elusimicrobiota bacterium]
MIEGRVRSINISNKKGIKFRVKKAFLIKNFGIKGDIHAKKNSRRQVSFLTYSEILKMKKLLGEKIKYGIFGENFDVSGVKTKDFKKGVKVCFDSGVILRVEKIGKTCPSPCEIFKFAGMCIMPESGIFLTVLKGGEVQEGEKFNLL